MDVSENWGLPPNHPEFMGVFSIIFTHPILGARFPPYFLGNTHIFMDSFMVQFSPWLTGSPSIDPTGKKKHPTYLEGIIPFLASGDRITDHHPPPFDNKPCRKFGRGTIRPILRGLTNLEYERKLVVSTNPFEKYQSKWIISPNRGENKNV